MRGGFFPMHLAVVLNGDGFAVNLPLGSTKVRLAL